MDTSHLGQQVNASIGQLHGLFDEIGVPDHEREAREAELFEALAEALNSQVRLVTDEKKEMVDEAKKMISAIRQMEQSLDDSVRRSRDSDPELQITYPLNACLQVLREKHSHARRLHKERSEQVMKLVDALESYSSHLEATFVQIPLPPTGANQSIPPSFDLSLSYVDKLDAEFTRVYDEYERRILTVQQLSEGIISLWAELGVPQAQQDGAVVKYYRDQPEQLGLHEQDIARLRSVYDRLRADKDKREKRLQDLRMAVESLWAKLEVDASETKAFVNANRGCGLRQINQFEDELARLNELKRQNMHLFVEDARVKLQELWDSLYFSEDEMLEFTPAFSDVYSDALLEAHEREVARLETLRDQRAPVLDLVRRYMSLIQERDDLATSSQDASRLMSRGQKGEKRDPGKLLREEKMRKRIAKELPKVKAELRKLLEKWEDEYDRPFLVHGERYLDDLESEDGSRTSVSGAKRPGTSHGGPPLQRSKTPGAGANAPTSVSKPPRSVPSRDNGTKSAPPGRAGAKTPTAGTRSIAGVGATAAAGATGRKTPARSNTTGSTTAAAVNGRGSPSRIPARAPLSNLKHGQNPSDRPKAANGDTTQSQAQAQGLRSGALMRAPPPKMRDLTRVPELETPANPYDSAGLRGGSSGNGSIIRAVESEDPYEDDVSHQHYRSTSDLSYQSSSHHHQHHQHPSYYLDEDDLEDDMDNCVEVYDGNRNAIYKDDVYGGGGTVRPSSSRTGPPSSRHMSATSHSSAGCTSSMSGVSSAITSGSENWETFDDNSEPERDASDAYYAKLKATRNRRLENTAGGGGAASSEVQCGIRGIPPSPESQQHYGYHQKRQYMDGSRIVSASGWTDEDGF
ncbi:protein regulator of cytokinesis 1 [Geosmithia morbida]|uniref:Protein regulator of cytokinesis 1 n=1 Tax=Geosmithia morbida TaxID=1094350 RepID=A0A9P5D3B7_9HYPO|nr:protein regulator of cytokinesis 1 [Geosmithia morbida]KAF4120349.1 protein regulator of cytokinesis 1 [Geosmithia morbida]